MDLASIAIIAVAALGTAGGIWWYIHARERERSEDLREHRSEETNR